MRKMSSQHGEEDQTAFAGIESVKVYEGCVDGPDNL